MSKHTPGPWVAARMVNEKNGLLLSRNELMEYLSATIDVSAKASGGYGFYFVIGEGKDVCHTGNGPTSAVNAALIAAAPELLELLENVLFDGGTTGDPDLDNNIRRAIKKAGGR